MLDGTFNRFVLIHHVLDGLAGVNDGTMVSAAKGVSNFLQRMVGKEATEVHGDLTWERNICGATARLHISHTQMVLVDDLLLNILNGNPT